MPPPRPRVLLSGPGPDRAGGIATLLRTIEESGLSEAWEFARFDLSRPRLGPRSRLSRWTGAALARGLGFDGYFELETFARLRAFEQALATPPALAHLHSSHGLDFLQTARMASLARRRGVPVLHHVHGNFDVFHPRWSRLRQAVFQRALAQPDRLVVLSEGWRRWFSAHMDPARIVVLPNPVDLRRFPHRPDERPAGPVRILFVGLIEARLKGAHDLLAAAHIMVSQGADVRFVCAGRDAEGFEAAHVRGTPVAARFEFLGQRSREEIARDFAAADVFVLPSHWEGMPLALLEAMAAGLPVVATRVGAVEEVVSDPGNALLVLPQRPDALAAALLRLLRDPALRAAQGRANRAKAEREHALPVFERRLGALYAELAAKSSRR